MVFNLSYDELKMLLNTIDTYLCIRELDDSCDPLSLTPYRDLYKKILYYINSLESQ